MTKLDGTEKKVARILASDLPVARKISQLEILALRTFASSPNQLYVIAARKSLAQGT